MQPVFLFPLAAAFLFAVGELFDKFLLENKMPNGTAYFFLQMLLAVVFFPLLAFLFFGVEFPGVFAALLIMFAAIVSTIGYLLYFFLVRNYDLSSVGPLTQAKLLFSIPLAYFFLNEFYGFNALLLMLFIFFGAALSTYSPKVSFKALVLGNRLLFFAMLMSLAWALGDLPATMLSNEISGPSFMIWRYIFSAPIIAVFAFFLLKGNARKALSQNLGRTLPLSFIAMLFGFTGTMLLFIAYGFSYSIPSALLLSQAIFVFAIAFVVSRLKSSLIAEKHTLGVYLVRLAGVLLIVSSIYFLMNGNMVF